MTEEQPQESDQLPEEAPAGQVSDEAGDREEARRSPPEQSDQGESRGADNDDETSQTGNPASAG